MVFPIPKEFYCHRMWKTNVNFENCEDKFLSEATHWNIDVSIQSTSLRSHEKQSMA